MPPPALVSITVTPDPATCTDEQSVRLVATGHYDDSSTADISNEVQWTSSDEDVASIRLVSFSNPGLAVGVHPGSCEITATWVPFGPVVG